MSRDYRQSCKHCTGDGMCRKDRYEVIKKRFFSDDKEVKVKSCFTCLKLAGADPLTSAAVVICSVCGGVGKEKSA